MKTIVYTILALLAFAGNSILCRAALGEESIDAASFTIIRLLAGIVVLAIIMQMTKQRHKGDSKGSWRAALMLFVYAATFSYAYISLQTGVGALILFGCVQMTMILAGFYLGKKHEYYELLGVIVAFSGFVYLVLPGASAPSVSGFALMCVSGIAWALYTLLGANSKNPLSDTAYNFYRTLPLVILMLAITIQDATMSYQGVVLAIVSGGVASGIGYAIWYAALGGLSSIQAGVLQLLVPVIASIGGVIFSHELLSYRLFISSLVILSGILVVILGRHYSLK